MADTLESLEIEVKHSASGAAEELKSVSSAIRGMGRALDNVIPKLREMNSALSSGGSVSFNRNTQIADTINNVNQAASKAGRATADVARSTKEVGKAAAKANKPLSAVVKSFGRIAFYRAIRTIIKNVAAAFSEGLQYAYAFSEGISGTGHRFAEAMDSMKSAGTQMKAQLGSAFIGLLAAVTPIVIQIINLVTKLADALSQLFAAFTGTTYLKANVVADKFADTMKKGAGSAKEWKNQLMGFDEINRLEEPSSGGGGSNTGLDPSQMFTETPIAKWVTNLANTVKDNLALIETVASGFSLALGLILTLSGTNIPLGLGLIAAGVFGFAHALKEDWGNVDQKVAACIHSITFVLGTGLLAIGAVLAFSGANIPLGLGLMAAGVANLATSTAIRWGLMDKEVGKSLTNIARTASLSMFAVGAVLALSGVATGAGLALMGASIVAYGTTLDWDNILNSFKGAWDKIKRFYNEHIRVFFTKEWWQGKIDAAAPSWDFILGGFRFFGEEIANIFTSLLQPIADFCAWIDSAIQGLSIFNGARKASSPNYNVYADPDAWLTGFASGGYPQTGELFLAQEQGPEMVGRIGNRTAVANNDQIVEAVSMGVANAVSAVLGNGGTDRPVKIFLDGREIATTTTRYQNQIARAGSR